MLGGCSFHRSWNAAEHATESRKNPLDGRWEGKWLSEVNGHTGKLRCLIQHQQNDNYQFYFWATYGKGLRVSYKAQFEVIPSTNGFEITGQKDLGKLGGGVYTWKGHIQDNQFQATYRNSYDHGTFEMQLLP